METKKSKYDTNPLDPDVAKKTEEVWGESADGPATQKIKGATSEVGSSANDSARSNIYSEVPTRRYDNPPVDAPYPSVFVPPTYSPPTPYQPPTTPYRPPPSSQPPSSRTVAGIGLPEKWATMLPYAPYIGVVACLLELFLVPRRELKVRFHASQGLALHIAIIVIQTLFGVLGSITDSSVGGSIFKTASLIFLIVSMIRVAKGEPHRIAPLAEPAQWLNERIEIKR